MQIDIPFEIGEKFYPCIKVKTKKVQCLKCKGMGGHSWEDEWSTTHFSPCKECGGRPGQAYPLHGGGIIIYKIDPIWEAAGEFTIQYVKIIADNTIQIVSDKHDWSDARAYGIQYHTFPIEVCFNTLKQAEAGAKKFNKKLDAMKKLKEKMERDLI